MDAATGVSPTVKFIFFKVIGFSLALAGALYMIFPSKTPSLAGNPDPFL